MFALAPAACLFPDLGGLRPGADSGSDACASCIGDAGPSDVVTKDVAPDSPPPPVDAGFCASAGAHTLCEDFDNGLYSAQFTNVHTTQFGTMGSNNAAYVSPPLSLFADIAARPTLGDQAFMTRVFTGSVSTATYSFDVRLDSWTTGGKAGVFAAIVLNDSLPTFHTLSLYTTDTYAALEEGFREPDGGTAYIDHTLTTSFQLGKWTHVSFSVDLNAKTCSAQLDGVTVVATSSMDTSWAPGPLGIDLGFSYLSSETAAWQARFDNVVYDQK